MRARFNKEDLGLLFFTSDTHFGHRGILKFCSRPYKSVEDMDSALIHNWNTTVPKNGHIFMLGDFSFHHQKETQKILRRLNGTKYLIIGNHDSGINGACKELFTGGVAHYHKLKCDGQPIILCHYAFRSWDQMGYGSWNLHGHSHGNLPPFGKQLDVGVDVHKYRPISYWEVAEYMKHRQIETADHH